MTSRQRRAAIVVFVLVLPAMLSLAGSSSAAPGDRRTVGYRGVALDVPADWPVVDLTADATRCARSDVNAVYLGHQGLDASCPAQVIGAAEGVQIAPWDDRTAASLSRPQRTTVDGEPAFVDRDAPRGGRIVVALPGPRTLVTVSFGEDRALADEIAKSIRGTDAPAGRSRGASPPRPSAPQETFDPAALGLTAAEGQPAPLRSGIYAGLGFDTCANPTVERMRAWLASPYRALGIYIGGINHGCKAQTLSAGWVADVARLGWSFMPLYVGLQAPCQASTTTAKINPATAAAQGRSAADDAVSRADLFGLPSGSPVYFDMEAYTGTVACRQAVLTFLDAWTVRLHQLGYVSGVYSSEASGIAHLSAAYDDPGFDPPDVIWTAHWGESPRIFGHNQTWLPDSLWTNHQRLHQYRGGHVETWGGQAINIDNDILDAPVVRFFSTPRWQAGDVDGGGGADLVHLCCVDYLNSWLSNGDGTYDVRSFRPWPRYGLQLGTWRSADVTGDARTDLLHFWGSDTINAFVSGGDGTYAVNAFRPWAGYGLATGSWQQADVNGDGRGDLIHLCCRDYVNVWLSNGNGTFSVSEFRPWSGYGVSLGSWRQADVNGDGRGDLVHLCCRDSVNVWLSDGDGTFTVAAFRPWSGYGIGLGSWLAADVNGDARGDLVHLCCRDSVNVWLSDGDGTFTVAPFRPWAGYAVGMASFAVTDVGGDGSQDLVHLCCGDSVNVWRSNGDGSFAVTLFRPWPGYGIGLGTWVAQDANADGRGDLVHLCCPSSLNTWISQGDGTFSVVPSPL